METEIKISFAPFNTNKKVIEIKNVSKRYMMGEVEVKAVNSINLQIYQGQIVSIVGPSGSGKTTLLNLIGALDYVDEGTIKVHDLELKKLSDSELSHLRRETIGYVFQSFNLLDELSAAKNIEMPMILAKVEKKKRIERVNELLKLVELENRSDHKPNQLSGGEQQRVAFARALANEPKIILADEPTGNLDTITGEKIMSLLLEVSEKKAKTLVYVTHNQNQAKLAPRQIFMRDGKIVEDKNNY